VAIVFSKTGKVLHIPACVRLQTKDLGGQFDGDRYAACNLGNWASLGSACVLDVFHRSVGKL